MDPRFRIVPLSPAYVRRVRHSLVDDLGLPVRILTAPAGGVPCRFTLQYAAPGEELLLLSHRPFARIHPYAETGPIFIRRYGDTGYATPHRFPPEIDPTTRVFRAYNDAEEIVDARLGTAAPAALIADLFANPAVAFLHVRSLTYGCFTFRIERG